MLQQAQEQAKDGMDKALERLQKELSRVRAGRANPGVLDDVKIDSYGTQMPLKQVATVTAPDARLLVVKAFDRNTVPAIERAINNSQLGLNASSDGIVVRVPIPALTEERRKGLTKQVQGHGEDAKIAVRQARREANDVLKQGEKDKDISEDDLKRGLEKIQVMTDDLVKVVDGIVEKKAKEILDG